MKTQIPFTTSSDLGSNTYTTPRFEDKTRAALIRDGDRVFEEIREHRKQLNELLHKLSLYGQLEQELAEAKIEKVSQLPKDRIEHWKGLLEERIYTYL